MSKANICIVLFVAIIGIKIVMNLSNAFYLQKQYNRYLQWLANELDDKVIYLRRNRTLALIKQANVADKNPSISQPIGNGYIAAGQASVLKAYPNRNKVFSALMSGCFIEAIGVYRGRAFDAINPLYWIRLIVYLPTHACSFLGADSDSLPVKILQGLYWLAAAAAGAIFAFAKAEFLAWLKVQLG